MAGAAEFIDDLHSEPIWMGEARAYEIATPPDVPAVSVHLVGPRRSAAQQPASAGVGQAAAATAPPPVQPRSSWGARPPVETPSVASGVKLAVVHHSPERRSGKRAA